MPGRLRARLCHAFLVCSGMRRRCSGAIQMCSVTVTIFSPPPPPATTRTRRNRRVFGVCGGVNRTESATVGDNISNSVASGVEVCR